MDTQKLNTKNWKEKKTESKCSNKKCISFKGSFNKFENLKIRENA